MRHTFIIIISLLAIILAGCSSIDCSINSRVMCHYSIQDKDGNPVAFGDQLSVILNRNITDGDTVFINQMSNVSTIAIPMSHIADTDAVTLMLSKKIEWTEDSIGKDSEGNDSIIKVKRERIESVSDKVWITKSNTALFESIDCAPRYNHNITGVRSTHNFIDTLLVNKDFVSKDASVPNIIIRINTTANK